MRWSVNAYRKYCVGETYDLVLRRAAVPSGGELVDIAVIADRIAEVTPSGARRDDNEPSAWEVVDCDGALVVPAFVEAHLHLDKALLDRPGWGRDGNGGFSRRRAIAATARRKASFTAADLRERAVAVLEWALRSGTTAVRAHTDVDPIVGLLGVEVLLDLRHEWRELVEIQVVAFPQEGIYRAPGTLALLRHALAAGADVVGGCPYNEDSPTDSLRHLDTVMGLAVEHGLPVDLHADFSDDGTDPRYALAEAIAAATTTHGLQGRVAVGHMTSLASLPPEDLVVVLGHLAAAGVAVVALPATDLHLGGRGDRRNVRRGVAPIRALWEAGVRTAYSSNNVRNAFTPSGRADMVDIGLLLARVSHLGTGDFERILEMGTTDAAAIIGRPGPLGIAPGARADLVVTGSRTVAELFLDNPERRYVFSRGRLVSSESRQHRWHGPAERLDA